MRSRLKIGLLLTAAVLAAAWMLRPNRDAEEAGTASAPAPLSLLALGDTGRAPARFSIDTQLRVARGLEDEDRRAPVDLLLLLGDNFYPDGLLASELEERVRANLVRPYCRFADLSGLLSVRVASACTLPEAERHRVPILAILGNHDHDIKESPRLQREVLPLYLSNWRAARGLVETVDAGAGVSLILLDSEPVLEGADLEPLVRALDEAPGPWRLLVTHRPITVKPKTKYAKRMRKALLAASRPPQLILSGHEHNLQAWQSERPAVFHVIAGSGALTRGIRGEAQLFASETLGFVRLDLEGDAAADERIVVSFFVADRPRFLGGTAKLASRWSVDRSGRARPDPGVRVEGRR